MYWVIFERTERISKLVRNWYISDTVHGPINGDKYNPKYYGKQLQLMIRQSIIMLDGVNWNRKGGVEYALYYANI